MADATWELDAKGGNKVVAEANKAEKAMNKVGRGSSKAGMAILEASRGIEDFAMAGMRGVMNNIPGFLQNLGVGMGMTGVISVATIAVWKGVEALEGYMNSVHAARLAVFELGLVQVDTTKMIEDAAKAALSAQESAEKAGGGFAKVISGMEEADAAKEKFRESSAAETAVQLEIDALHAMIRLTEDRATEEEKRHKDNEKALLSEEDKVKHITKLREDAEQSLALKKKLREQDQAIVGGSEPTAKNLEWIEKKVKKRQLEHEVKNAAVGELYVKGHPILTNTPYTGGLIRDALEEWAMKDAHAKATAYREELLDNPIGKRLEEELKLQEAAKLRIAQIDTEIEKNQTLVDSRKQEEEAAKRILLLQEKKIMLTEELANLEGVQKKEDEAEKERIDQQKSMMEERVTDPSAFLTSQGRAGLSGNETQNALGLIGIARQQLTQLKTIARNTRNFNTTYA